MPRPIGGSSTKRTSRSPAAGATSTGPSISTARSSTGWSANAAAARAFFARALTHGAAPAEVTTDRAPVYPRVINELVRAARHVFEQYANNRVEADHGRLKARLRPMRGMKTISTLRTIAAGHAFVQNVRRGHYEITADVDVVDRVRVVFKDLARCL